MRWLRVIIVYYVLLYLLLGRIAVDLFELTTWPHMVGIFIGCCIGHYLGKMDAGWVSVGKGRRAR